MTTETSTEASSCSIRQRAEPIFDVNSLDLGRCHTLEINTALNEFEVKHPGLSQRFHSWPPDVQRRINGELDKWIAGHPNRVVRLVSNALYQGVAVMLLHHTEK